MTSVRVKPTRNLYFERLKHAAVVATEILQLVEAAHHLLGRVLRQIGREGRLGSRMVLKSRFSTITVLLALLAAPDLSCLVPRALLGIGDVDCCQRMGSHCNSHGMPSSSTCCKSLQQDTQPYVRSADILTFCLARMPLVAAVLPAAPPVASFAVDASSIIRQSHSFPVSPAETISVLRI